MKKEEEEDYLMKEKIDEEDDQYYTTDEDDDQSSTETAVVADDGNFQLFALDSVTFLLFVVPMYAVIVGSVVILFSDREMTENQKEFSEYVYDKITYPFFLTYGATLTLITLIPYFIIRTKYKPAVFSLPTTETCPPVSPNVMLIVILALGFNSYFACQMLSIPYNIGCYLLNCFTNGDMSALESFLIISASLATIYGHMVILFVIKLYSYNPLMHCAYLWEYLYVLRKKDQLLQRTNVKNS